MSDVIAAGRYTRALFQLAEKEGHLEETETSLKALARTLEKEPKILKLIANPTLTSEQKCALALASLADNRTGLMERFLRVLIDKKRFALVLEIQKLFHASFERKKGVQEVELFSAISLSSDFMGKLKSLLTKKLRLEIRLIAAIAPELLGGFVLRFAGKEIDCSFKNSLHEIQQSLLNEPTLS